MAAAITALTLYRKFPGTQSGQSGPGHSSREITKKFKG